jgi:hypothetical protein
VNYLTRGRIQSADCARSTFQLIQDLPREESIPILIKYLGYRRPLSEAENHGLFAHGPLPEVLYPAVESLYKIGLPAEAALLDAVAHIDPKDSIEYKNALYALVLIRHSDVLPLIKTIHERGIALAGTPEASRLESAAQDLKKRYCHGKLLQPCDDALRQ